MRKILLTALLLTAVVAVGGWFSPQPGLKTAGGGGARLTGGMIEDGDDGNTFTLTANSKLPFAHYINLQYRYVPGYLGVYAGQDTGTLVTAKYFAQSGDAENVYSKEIVALGLYHGDSLYVHIDRTALDDSTVVLDTYEIGYLIDHSKWPGGNAFAVILSADDGYVSNLSWSAAADSMGFTYSLMPSLATTAGIDVAGMLTSEQLALVASRGVEIGYTGNHHRDFGVNEFSRAVATFPDSFVAYYDPADIEAITGAAVVTQAVDKHYFNWLAAALLDSMGYTNARAGYWDGSATQRGFSVIAPGYRAWDLARPLDWYKPSAIFGYASWSGENIVENGYDEIFDTGAGSADQETISVRLDRVLNESARNGFAPVSIVIHNANVTREDLENFVEICRARGDVWITTHRDMAAWYRSHHEPRSAAPWMTYATALGIAAEDSLVWGPPLPQFSAADSAAAETYIFSNSTTRVNVGDYDHSYTDGMYDGNLMADYPDSAIASTAALSSRFCVLPLDVTERMAWMAFNVDELDAMNPDKIINATLSWYHDVGSGEEYIGSEAYYYCLIGVASSVLFEGLDESDTSLNYSDTSERTAWTEDISAYTDPHQFGDYVYGDYTLEGAKTTHFVSQDVTEYLRYVVQENLPSAAFIFWGRTGSERYNAVRSHRYASATVRPYLVVTVAP